MSRVYVGNLDPRATERELEDEFRVYGVLRRFVCVSLSVLFPFPWFHRNPWQQQPLRVLGFLAVPGYALFRRTRCEALL